MALKFSTALRNFLLGEGSVRKCFEDGVIKIYSGSAPATADAAFTGTLLCTISKASGTVSASERSTEKIHHVTIPDSHASGATVKLNVTVDGVGPTTYTYTNTPDLDAAPMMIGVARMINDIPQLMAIPDVTAREIYVMSRIAGLDFTLADGSGTVTATVDAAVQAAARQDAIQWGLPASGEMAKETSVWSGVNAATGTAGYFRIVTSSDDGTLVTTTQERIQGTVGTSGADLNMSSVNLTSGATTTIDSLTISIPAS